MPLFVPYPSLISASDNLRCTRWHFRLEYSVVSQQLKGRCKYYFVGFQKSLRENLLLKLRTQMIFKEEKPLCCLKQKPFLTLENFFYNFYLTSDLWFCIKAKNTSLKKKCFFENQVQWKHLHFNFFLLTNITWKLHCFHLIQCCTLQFKMKYFQLVELTVYLYKILQSMGDEPTPTFKKFYFFLKTKD